MVVYLENVSSTSMRTLFEDPVCPACLSFNITRMDSPKSCSRALRTDVGIGV